MPQIIHLLKSVKDIIQFSSPITIVLKAVAKSMHPHLSKWILLDISNVKTEKRKQAKKQGVFGMIICYYYLV